MDLKELDLVDPANHWYYQSKMTYVHDALNRVMHSSPRIMDIGAGSGFFSQSIHAAHENSTVICVDPFYASDQLTSGNDTFHFVREASRGQIESSNLFLFIDVLEHVDDDLALLTAYADPARPSSVFLLSVPAFKSLWSGHDVFLEHKRRYRRRELEVLATRAGLDVRTSSYWFGALFLPVWLQRRLSRDQTPKSQLKMHPRWLDSLLRSVSMIDRHLPLRRVTGLSCYVVAVKP